jgi:hypothetical protein
MPSACDDATVLKRVTDQTAFQAWHDTTKNQLDDTDLNLVTLTTIEKQITDSLSCLQVQIQAKRALPNSNYTLQEEIVQQQTILKDLTENVQTAKERAESVRNLDQKVNPTEDWFPIGRPLQQTSLFALIALSIFFTMMFIGLMASYFGFELNLSWVPGPSQVRTPTTSIFGLLYSWTNPLSLALITSLVVTISLILWLRTKTS